jgi:hypothetical protein
VPANGAAVTSELTQAERNLSINELRHVYRRKLLALDRRRDGSIEAPRPHFWIRADVLERILATQTATENAGDRQNGERKAKKHQN